MKERVKIGLHLGISVFLYQKGTRGMSDEDRHNTLARCKRFQASRDLIEPGPLGLDVDKGCAHWSSVSGNAQNDLAKDARNPRSRDRMNQPGFFAPSEERLKVIPCPERLGGEFRR